VHLCPGLCNLEVIGKKVCCKYADLSRAVFYLVSEKWAVAYFLRKPGSMRICPFSGKCEFHVESDYMEYC